MTKIDLPKRLCSDLADYLRSKLQVGISGNYQLVELLVLAARALSDAEECSGGAAAPPDAPAADKPPALGAMQDAPRGAAAAALFKRDTLARLEAYRRRGDGVLSLDPLAKLCKPVDGKSVDAAVLAQMLRRWRKRRICRWLNTLNEQRQ